VERSQNRSHSGIPGESSDGERGGSAENAGCRSEQVRKHAEKIEGLVILDGNTIAVANDNDFDTAENKYDADGNNIGKGTNNQVIVISLAKQLPLAVPAIASAATPTDGAK
jgi:hypothetical protein